MINEVVSPYGFFDDWNDWKRQWKWKWGAGNSKSYEAFPKRVNIELPDFIDSFDEYDGSIYLAQEDIPKLIAYLEGKQRELQTD